MKTEDLQLIAIEKFPTNALVDSFNGDAATHRRFGFVKGAVWQQERMQPLVDLLVSALKKIEDRTTFLDKGVGENYQADKQIGHVWEIANNALSKAKLV